MISVVLLSEIEFQYVIQVNNDKFVHEWIEYLIHESPKGG